MRKQIVMTIVFLFAISMLMGCAKEITSSDGGGNVYDFWVGDINFHYERDGHSGLCTAYNPTTYWVWINVKECDARCDERQGISFTLSENGQTYSWRAYYEPGGKIKITMRMDGVESINVIKLGKISVNDADIEIKEIKLFIGSIDEPNQREETSEINEADYAEITFLVTAW